MDEKIEAGLDILRREGRGARGKRRDWPLHNELLRRARAHVEACGGCWAEYGPRLSREFAELLRL